MEFAGAVTVVPGAGLVTVPAVPGTWLVAEFAGLVTVAPGVVVVAAPGTALPWRAFSTVAAADGAGGGGGGGGTVRPVAGAWYADAISTIPARLATARTAKNPRM